MSSESDNESWDITTNLGTTALGVASQRAAETAQRNPLVRDDFAAVMVAASNEPGWQTMATGDLSWMGPEDDKDDAQQRPDAITSPPAQYSSTTTVPLLSRREFGRS
jgi:O-methyltransferase involved in polyketide biosynthesis